jgi:uncharacterized protein (TIGR02271 family)
MSTTAGYEQIVPGLPVMSRDGMELGLVERFDGTQLQIPGWSVPVAAIDRVENNVLYLRLARDDFKAEQSTATANQEAGNRMVIPLAEERLTVGTREVIIGEVVIRKRIVEEERLVPVTIRREEVEFVRLAPGEALPDGWDADAAEITRLPLHSSEPTFEKTAVVNREVIVERGVQTEQRDITGTVRREHAEVEERYLQARPQFERDFTAQFVAGDTKAVGFAEAEPQYRAGFFAGHDPRYAGADFDTVEPALRQEYGAGAQQDGDGWEALRRRIRTGFEAARR